MAAKYHHIFDTFKHFWVARKPNFFDPSMAIGGAAISFFLTWNFGLKFILGHNFVKKIGCTHFWNHVLSKKLDKMAKKWNSKLCWSLVKTLFFCSKHGKSWFFRLRMAYWMTECYRIKNFSLFHQFDKNSTKFQSSLFDHFCNFFGQSMVPKNRRTNFFHKTDFQKNFQTKIPI